LLFSAGTASLGLFVILEGRVRVTTFRWARAHAVHEEGPGGTLGEVPLFAGGGYPATAVAAEPTVCAVLGREVVAAILRADPDWAWMLLERLAVRVRHLVGRLDRNTAQSVPARLASFLLDCRDRVKSDVVSLGKTQQEVAEDLGTVREVIVRTLARLRRAGLLATERRGRYRILDLEGLLGIAQGRGM
jgi:CRP/FNR family transcriptional regulator